tara:strand:- start:247 stop:501 length:255 start_codon:yes stop_codon:yes gene_type:complete
MKKSKREKQIELLEALLKRIKTNARTNDTSQEVYDNNILWVQNKIDEVAGGDVNLNSGGLTKDDMILANGMWKNHASPFLKQGQ